MSDLWEQWAQHTARADFPRLKWENRPESVGLYAGIWQRMRKTSVLAGRRRHVSFWFTIEPWFAGFQGFSQTFIIVRNKNVDQIDSGAVERGRARI
jgi:hypothetical protein